MFDFWNPKTSPLGIDVSARGVKLVQLSDDRTRLHELARWDWPAERSDPSPDERAAQLTEALQSLRQGRNFQGADAVICLGYKDLFVQSVRVPRGEAAEVERKVQAEIAGRLPFPAHEAELRTIDVGDVKQGEATLREVIALACHRPVLERLLAAIEAAGLSPVGVDAEPLAVLRAFRRQFRRDEDRTARTLCVQIGYQKSLAILAAGDDPLLIKYIDLGGKQLDEAVARHLKMSLTEAAALRRHNGDRRSDQQNPEIARSVAEACRSAFEKLAGELALCLRYHSVTFRGQPLSRLVVGGGEATPALAQQLGERLNIPAELSEPFRFLTVVQRPGREGQWDLALGLALKELPA